MGLPIAKAGESESERLPPLSFKTERQRSNGMEENRIQLHESSHSAGKSQRRREDLRVRASLQRVSGQGSTGGIVD